MIKKIKQNNKHTIPNVVEASQFLEHFYSGEMSLGVSGTDSFHRRQPEEEHPKGWSHVLLYWPSHMADSILVPWPGIEPTASVVKA